MKRTRDTKIRQLTQVIGIILYGLYCISALNDNMIAIISYYYAGVEY